MVSNPKETYKKLCLFGMGPEGIRYIFISYIYYLKGLAFPCKKNIEKISNFLAYVTQGVPMSVHKKISAHSVQPFGPPEGTYL